MDAFPTLSYPKNNLVSIVSSSPLLSPPSVPALISFPPPIHFVSEVHTTHHPTDNFLSPPIEGNVLPVPVPPLSSLPTSPAVQVLRSPPDVPAPSLLPMPPFSWFDRPSHSLPSSSSSFSSRASVTSTASPSPYFLSSSNRTLPHTAEETYSSVGTIGSSPTGHDTSGGVPHEATAAASPPPLLAVPMSFPPSFPTFQNRPHHPPSPCGTPPDLHAHGPLNAAIAILDPPLSFPSTTAAHGTENDDHPRTATEESSFSSPPQGNPPSNASLPPPPLPSTHGVSEQPIQDPPPGTVPEQCHYDFLENEYKRWWTYYHQWYSTTAFFSSSFFSPPPPFRGPFPYTPCATSPLPTAEMSSGGRRETENTNTNEDEEQQVHKKCHPVEEKQAMQQKDDVLDDAPTASLFVVRDAPFLSNVPVRVANGDQNRNVLCPPEAMGGRQHLLPPYFPSVSRNVLPVPQTECSHTIENRLPAEQGCFRCSLDTRTEKEKGRRESGLPPPPSAIVPIPTATEMKRKEECAFSGPVSLVALHPLRVSPLNGKMSVTGVSSVEENGQSHPWMEFVLDRLSLLHRDLENVESS